MEQVGDLYRAWEEGKQKEEGNPMRKLTLHLAHTKGNGNEASFLGSIEEFVIIF